MSSDAVIVESTTTGFVVRVVENGHQTEEVFQVEAHALSRASGHCIRLGLRDIQVLPETRTSMAGNHHAPEE